MIFRSFKKNILKYFSSSFIINVIYFLYSYIKKTKFKKIYNLERLKSEKKSNTLVILGPSVSLNDLSELEKNELEDYDIVGMSFTCFYKIKQKFFFLETNNNDEIAKTNGFKITDKLIEKYKNNEIEHIIWKNPEENIIEKYQDMSLFKKTIKIDILGTKEIFLKKYIRFIVKYKFFHKFLFQTRGTLISLVIFGLNMRYKKIIFCGIDLNSTSYFFEDEEYKSLELINGFKANRKDRASSTMHSTVNPRYGTPVDETIQLISEEFKEVEFYVIGKKSRLAKFLPIWRFKVD